MVDKESKRKCYKCGSSPAEDNISLFRFFKPGTRNLHRCALWAQYIFPDREFTSIELQKKLYSEHRLLCQRHFKDEDFTDSSKKQLLRTAVPCDIIELPICPVNQPGPSHLEPVYISQETKIAQKEQSSLQAKCAKHLIKICQLRNRIKTLKSNKILNELIEDKSVKQLSAKITPAFALLLQGQIRNFKRHVKGRRWSKEEKITALRIFKRSPTCYRLLRRLFTLPSPRTLQNLLNKVPFCVGVSEPVLKVLRKFVKTQKFSDNEYILMFDEMSLKKHLSYNLKNDTVDGFQDHSTQGRSNLIAGYALVFMIGGIRQRVKQPIAYFFSSGFSTSDRLAVLIKEVLHHCSVSEVNIAAIVCDMDGVNRKALSNLGASAEHPYITIGTKEIVVMYDTPHLLKCFRNMFIKYDIECKTDINSSNKTGIGIAKWSHIKEFHNLDTRNPNFVFAPSLKKDHLNPNTKQKMKVNMAAQVLSHSVAAGMFAKISDGTLNSSATVTANVISNMDKLFDSVNADSSDLRRGKPHATNMTASSPHLQLFADMKTFFSTMKFVGSPRRPPSQDGWIWTLNAIERLWRNLVEKYNIKSMATRRLQQDPLENLFGCIRGNCGSNTNPTCGQFLAGLKTAVLSNLSRMGRTGNCETDNHVIINNFDSLLSVSRPKPHESDKTSDTDVVASSSSYDNRIDTDDTSSALWSLEVDDAFDENCAEIQALAGTAGSSEKPKPVPLTGIQVVKFCENGHSKYELNEEALTDLLLRNDLRDRSVVLVSVAGQFRRGKSFLLDLFLRYLTADRSSQLSGKWLTIERENWEGFKYRGGSDRHTTGIHLWPEPILVDLDDGQKVAVLLMDTQGTFDQESTLAENSMIFALSTLMSSVQIYNLSGNIGEDDLQHLQLFTEYGRLASDGKAFQTLLFLVRDWMHAKQHKHGFGGGEDLLDKRLEPQRNQKEELRKVRAHIRSCFESIKCFLMPFPGIEVASGDGDVKDLAEQFCTSLLELVPALFDTKKLILKRINGHPVKAKYLLDLFKKYVDVFNSDTIPEAKTIFEATAEMWLVTILNESRDLYEERMTSHVRDDASVPPSRMQHWHEDSVTAAVDAFNSKRTLGPQEAVDATLAQLRRELESRFSIYSLQNDAKTRKTFADAKALYQSVIDEVCEAQSKLCLHSKDLERLHRQALEDALDFFNSKRNADCEDVESIRLEQELRTLYQQMCAMNEQNNSTAVLQAHDRYLNKMRTYLSDSGVSTEYLQTQHDAEKANALRHFDAQRNLATEQPQDSYREQLNNDVEDTFRDLKARNASSNRIAKQVAEYAYNNYITDAWWPQSSCFHPRALAEMHETAKDEAMTQFLAERPESENDDFKDRLARTLDRRYERLQLINTANNEDAALQAWNEYTRLMDKWTQPALVSIIVVPFFVKLIVKLPKYQEKAKAAAMVVWNSKRSGRSFSGDTYLTELKEKIDGAYDGYRNPILAFLREIGVAPDDLVEISKTALGLGSNYEI